MKKVYCLLYSDVWGVKDEIRGIFTSKEVAEKEKIVLTNKIAPNKGDEIYWQVTVKEFELNVIIP